MMKFIFLWLPFVLVSPGNAHLMALNIDFRFEINLFEVTETNGGLNLNDDAWPAGRIIPGINPGTHLRLPQFRNVSWSGAIVAMACQNRTCHYQHTHPAVSIWVCAATNVLQTHHLKFVFHETAHFKRRQNVTIFTDCWNRISCSTTPVQTACSNACSLLTLWTWPGRSKTRRGLNDQTFDFKVLRIKREKITIKDK